MIGVRIEMVPAYIGEVYDIGFGNGALVRDQRVADLQLFEIFAERMFLIFTGGAAGLVYIGDGGNYRGRTLYGHALHIMTHATDAAHFFAAACTTRPAMH